MNFDYRLFGRQSDNNGLEKVIQFKLDFWDTWTCYTSKNLKKENYQKAKSHFERAVYWISLSTRKLSSQVSPSLSSKWLKDASKGLSIISFSYFFIFEWKMKPPDSLRLPPQPSAATDQAPSF